MSEGVLFNFVGTTNTSGESAYDIWKSLNPDGTPAQFIEQLGALPEVTDNLEGTSPKKALSENQGRILNEKIDNLIEIGGNGGEASVDNVVLYTEQTLTDEEKTQARTNIDAASRDEVEQLSGTVEITNSNPEKRNTVLTVNPNANEVKIYTAEEVDDLVGGLSEQIKNLPSGGNGTSKVFGDLQRTAIYPCSVIYLDGDTSSMTKDVSVMLDISIIDEYGNEFFRGKSETSWQGSGSLSYPNKNLSIKLKSPDGEKAKVNVFEDYATHSYHLKCNYLDYSMVRNSVGAQLAHEFDDTVFPVEAPITVKSIPVIVYLNGTFNGCYTLNYKQDDKLFGMDSKKNPLTEIVYRSGLGTWTIGNFEYRGEATESADIKAVLQEMMNFASKSNDETFTAEFENHFDLNNAINYWLYADIACATDNMINNFTVATWDGHKWYMCWYDLDIIFGLMEKAGNSTHPNSPTTDLLSLTYTTNNPIWVKLYRCFYEQIRTRYWELRESIANPTAITSRFRTFQSKWGSENIKKDRSKWSGRPNTTTDVDNMYKWITDRLAFLDEKYSVISGVTYTITNNLTNAKNSNSVTRVVENDTYTAEITASSGYELETVTITMNGVDITSEAYTDGVITIPIVTGNIVITVVAVVTENGDTPTDTSLLYELPEPTAFDGTNYIDTGVAPLATNSDVTFVMEFEQSFKQNNIRLFSIENANGDNNELAFCMFNNYWWVVRSGDAINTQIDITKDVKRMVLIGSGGTWSLVHNDVDKNITTINISGVKGVSLKNLILGAETKYGGTEIKDMFKGTIHTFKVYDGILTENEIIEFLESESEIPEEPDTPEEPYTPEIPSTYTRLEYIEGNGTQWLDTGKVFKYAEADEFYMKFSPTEINNVYVLFGSQGNENVNTQTNQLAIVKNKLRIFQNNNETTHAVELDKIYEYIVKDRMIAIDGDEYQFNIPESNISEATVTLFGKNILGEGVEQNNTTSIACMRLYELYYKENGIETIHLYPVLDENGVACMYDTVSQTCIYNAGTGEFLYSEEPYQMDNLLDGVIVYPGYLKDTTGVVTITTSTDVCTDFIQCGEYVNDTWLVEYKNSITEDRNNRIVFYDENMAYITYSNGSGSIVVPTTAKYFRISVTKSDVLVTISHNGRLIGYNSLLTGITLSESLVTFSDDTPITLTATLEPSNAFGIITWSSSDNKIAHVTNGVVTPVRRGSCVITANCENVSATCDVVVDVDIDEPEYTRLEYIEGTGTQYLDTGKVFKYAETDEFYMKFAITTNSGTYVLMGSDGSGTSGNQLVAMGGNLRLDQCSQSKVSYSAQYIYEYVVKDGTAIVAGVTNQLSIQENDIPPHPVYVFGKNVSGNGVETNTIANMRLYELYYKENGVETIHLIPVLDENGIPCMYDTVSRRFIYNAGTGEFLYA